MLTNVFFDALFLSIASAVIASVYIGILSYEEFFSFWWRFGNRFEDRWFFKPVWACEKCFAGQFSAWTYLLARIHIEKTAALPGFPWLPWRLSVFPAYSLTGHLFCICAAIFLAVIFTQLIKRITNNY